MTVMDGACGYCGSPEYLHTRDELAQHHRLAAEFGPLTNDEARATRHAEVLARFGLRR